MVCAPKAICFWGANCLGKPQRHLLRGGRGLRPPRLAKLPCTAFDLALPLRRAHAILTSRIPPCRSHARRLWSRAPCPCAAHMPCFVCFKCTAPFLPQSERRPVLHTAKIENAKCNVCLHRDTFVNRKGQNRADFMRVFMKQQRRAAGFPAARHAKFFYSSDVLQSWEDGSWEGGASGTEV